MNRVEVAGRRARIGVRGASVARFAHAQRAWVACALVALAVASWTRTGLAAGRTQPDDFTVVTLNLWHDKADWPARKRQIVDALRRIRPDVIALQEVLQDTGLPNQATSLAEALGYQAVFASVDPPDRARRYGNALLTRHRVESTRWKALAPADDYRNAIHARIAWSGRALDVYVSHLCAAADRGDVRREQVGDLLAFANETGSAPTRLFAGDFNAPFDAPEFAALAAHLRDAYDTRHPGVAQDDPLHSTLNMAYNPPLRIDHVLYEPATLELREATRLFDRPRADGGWASDHFGVLARFAWKTHRRTDAPGRRTDRERAGVTAVATAPLAGR